jgi:hypothetical protein
LFGDLIARYGEDAIVRAWPHMLESGKTYRWQLEIDGVDVPGVAAQVRKHPEHDHLMVMLLVCGDEEIELIRWSRRMHPRGPGAVVRRLGDLR